MIPVLAVVGPTAVGKTAWTIELAESLSAEIISADSMQIYRQLDIGTAKPSHQERKGIPHHLIDIVNPDEDYSVADYQRAARQLIAEIWSRNHLPMLVGGTGLYVKAVLDNYLFTEIQTDLVLRQQLLDEAAVVGGEVMLERLHEVDPQSALKLHPNDLRRIVRALEVFHLSGRPASEIQAEGQSVSSPYLLEMVGLTRDREHLYQRINQRTLNMISNGLISEVKQLLDAGYSPSLRSMQGLGYRQVTEYLLESKSIDETVEDLQRQTRRYAKRQWTWFRADPRIAWVNMDSDNLSAFEKEITERIEGKFQLAANTIEWR